MGTSLDGARGDSKLVQLARNLGLGSQGLGLAHGFDVQFRTRVCKWHCFLFVTLLSSLLPESGYKRSTDIL